MCTIISRNLPNVALKGHSFHDSDTKSKVQSGKNPPFSCEIKMKTLLISAKLASLKSN